MSGPIPLGQANTGGNGGMIMALAVCCMCSSSSGIAGFLFRDKISAAMGGGGGSAAGAAGATGAAVGVAATRAPRPSAPRARAVKRIRIKRKPRRIARKIRKVFRRRRPSRRPKRSRRIFGRRRRSKRRRPSRRRRRVGRRVGRGAVKVAKLAWKYHPKNVVKRAALRAFNKSRVGKKFNRSRFGKRMNRGIKKAGRGIRRLFRRRRRRRCFAPNTPILLKNGDTRCIKDVELGDVLVNGSVVKATMEILNENDVYYKLPGDILVTGSHYVKDGDTFKQVKNIEKAERTDTVDKIVHCLVTSDHKIPVGDYVFWDWEDNLIV